MLTKPELKWIQPYLPSEKELVYLSSVHHTSTYLARSTIESREHTQTPIHCSIPSPSTLRVAQEMVKNVTKDITLPINSSSDQVNKIFFFNLRHGEEGQNV